MELLVEDGAKVLAKQKLYKLEKGEGPAAAPEPKPEPEQPKKEEAKPEKPKPTESREHFFKYKKN